MCKQGFPFDFDRSRALNSIVNLPDGRTMITLVNFFTMTLKTEDVEYVKAPELEDSSVRVGDFGPLGAGTDRVLIGVRADA